MHQESGRTLIEIIGVLAIAAIMTTAVIGTYNVMHNRSVRTIATADLTQMVQNIRLLIKPRGDYTGVSVDYLVKAGALRNTRAPIGNNDWSVTAIDDGAAFSINLTGLSNGECAYFTTAVPSWATAVRVNGYGENSGDYCLSTGNNQVSFIAE